MESITIHTDGASRNNPGRGGYGIVTTYETPFDEEPQTTTASRGFAHTTNNRMELMAVAVALETLVRPCHVRLFSDSEYVVNAITKGWLESWQERGWKASSRKPVANIDLWERVAAQLDRHDVEASWVKGHADDAENELADRLATAAADDVDNLDVDEGYEDAQAPQAAKDETPRQLDTDVVVALIENHAQRLDAADLDTLYEIVETLELGDPISDAAARELGRITYLAYRPA